MSPQFHAPASGAESVLKALHAILYGFTRQQSLPMELRNYITRELLAAYYMLIVADA